MASEPPPKSASAPRDKIIREIPVIERYARHNEAEDYRFRQFLKARLNRPSAETDAIVRQVTDEVWDQIDCTACAHCCKTLQVAVDRADINRLAKRLGISPRQFDRQYVRRSGNGEQALKSSPCVFLGSDNRCTVYEDRPKACRDFPYLHEPHFVSRSLIMIRNTSVCPIVFNVWQALKQKLRRKVP